MRKPQHIRSIARTAANANPAGKAQLLTSAWLTEAEPLLNPPFHGEDIAPKFDSDQARNTIHVCDFTM